MQIISMSIYFLKLERRFGYRRRTTLLEGSRLIGLQFCRYAAGGSRETTQRVSFAQCLRNEVLSGPAHERQRPWRIVARFREPPAACLQNCNPTKRLPSRRRVARAFVGNSGNEKSRQATTDVVGAVHRLLVLEIDGVSTRSSLPCVLVFKESHAHDLKVERQGPILHVPKVIVNSF
jgi:hypothetical protein